MARIAYDTEFLEDGKTIDLISIGMVRADTGESIYAINREMDVERILAHPWLLEHVWPSLPTKACEPGKRCHPPKPYNQHLDRDDPDVRPRRQIARMVERFVLSTPDPQLWAYYGAYDHVVMCQLFGGMIDLPDDFPMWTNDIKQEAVRLGVDKLPQQPSGVHNALADAKHNVVMLRSLDRIARGEKVSDE